MENSALIRSQWALYSVNFIKNLTRWSILIESNSVIYICGYANKLIQLILTEYIRSKSDRKFGDDPYNVSFTYVIVWLVSILELHNMFKKFFEFCWHVFQKLLVFISFLELTNFFLLKKKTIKLVINNLSRVITFCGIFLSISYWALFSKYFLAYIKEWMWWLKRIWKIAKCCVKLLKTRTIFFSWSHHDISRNNVIHGLSFILKREHITPFLHITCVCHFFVIIFICWGLAILRFWGCDNKNFSNKSHITEIYLITLSLYFLHGKLPWANSTSM